MPRKPRVFVEGGIYHVYNRFASGEAVFADPEEALEFIELLRFVKKRDIPMGETRFVTVVSPDEPDATELMLEPCGEHPATKAFKKAIYEEGIPLTAFLVDDIAKEYERLTAKGVEFRSPPQRRPRGAHRPVRSRCFHRAGSTTSLLIKTPGRPGCLRPKKRRQPSMAAISIRHGKG